eukprot:CAMPEP_0197394706 /NCGR_PEP_ID=MMETSP1165-20131217/5832_1 /TAXON_ID=284809 /ORGANISM="Chrysocystis fragilis, Strain CCMP3189" /LENGTH=229 /DNA_ID=CAMNT_0042920433 /DNA_START=119 /DNA_END=808 /DNA_ORIENTATION=-
MTERGAESPAQRQLVIVAGGRKATPLGRMSTPTYKAERVAELSSAIDEATLMFSFKGDGLNVKVMNDLRKKLPESARASVTKNKLMKRASEQSGLPTETEAAAPLFAGTSLWIFSGEDLKETIKAYDAWIKDNGLKEGGYDIKGGFMEGSPLDEAGVKAVIDLPTKPELMARLAGAINMAGPLGIATKLKNAKGNPQGLAVRLKKAAGGKLATALKISVADEEKNPNAA